MNTDIKAPGSENESSESQVEIGVNKTIAPKVDTTAEAAPEAKAAPVAEPAPMEAKAEQSEPQQDMATTSEQPVETSTAPEIAADKPVPPANTINLAEQGTPLAQQVAQETEEQKKAREEEKNKLANEGALNPTKPSTDGIKGQSMAGMVQEMNSEDNMNNSGTPQPQQPNTENNQMPTADNQAQQPTKKKSWWKFW